MNKKRRMKNRDTARKLARDTAPPCPECGQKGAHWIGVPMTLADLMSGTLPEGFWLCDKFYGSDGKRLPANVEVSGASRPAGEASGAEGANSTVGLCMELPPGWEVVPFHKHCPKCGCDLSKEFVDPKSNKPDTKDVKGGTDKTGVARMPTDDANRVHSSLQRMVCPLSKTNTEHTERNKRSRDDGIRLEQPGTRKDEHENANHHKYLVPVVKRNFRQRIFHWLFRWKVKMHNAEITGRASGPG